MRSKKSLLRFYNKRPGLLADLIKKMFANAEIKGRQVYLSITGHNIIIGNATLPKMPDSELADAAKWNAKEENLMLKGTKFTIRKHMQN